MPSESETTQSIGTVYLIGAGPGDPGLFTLRGKEVLETADVVIYDRLVHPTLLNLIRPDAERIYVGKASAHHSVRQPDINALLVENAKRGKNVARLKGGDPYVFGRGGEEAEYCQEHGIPFEVVPGVTSAIAAPAYAGIPVTHRDAASSFAVITGHERDDSRESGTRAPGGAETRRNWKSIANAADTLVFLMGVEALAEITQKLMEHGRDANTPIALVQWGTWFKQRVVVGTLNTIVAEVEKAKLTPPAVCIVGEVVNQREKLRWFDNPKTMPLLGKRILVTRAREQASNLTNFLRSKGAEPVEFPVIRIQETDDNSLLEQVVTGKIRHDWIIFTSVNAVNIFAKHLKIGGKDSRYFSGMSIGAIGTATAEAIQKQFAIVADYVPKEAVGEAMLEEFPTQDLREVRILIPRALEARDVLVDGLRNRQASVDVLPIYKTVLESGNSEQICQQIEAKEIDVVTFTSSSTVKNFVSAIGESGKAALIANSVVIAAIGPITAETATSLGLPPTLIAEDHTIPGLVAVLENHYRETQL